MHKPFARRRATRGVTLIETCITLAVLVIIIASAAPSFAEATNRRRMEGLAEQIRADVQSVRATAVARGEPVRLALFDNPAGTGYLLHTGGKDDCKVDNDGTVHCEDSALVLNKVLVPVKDAIRVQGDPKSMRFDPFQGNASPGTLKVIGASNREIHVVVNMLGRARTCTPVAGKTEC